jgi:hypothetical protein
MKQNETERNRMSFCFVLKWIEMEQIRTNTHGPFRSERSGAELEEGFLYHYLHKQSGTEWGMEWNGME